jgi:dipeptidyl-peptidase-4
MPRRLRLAVLIGSVLVAGAVPHAQAPARLSIDVIYDPATRLDFSGTPPTDLSWLDTSTYLWARRGDGGYDWMRVDAATGAESRLFAADAMASALAALPGVDAGAARTAARARGLTLNPARSGALVTIADDLYFYDFGSSRAVRLTATAGREDEPSFSPDGRLVAFLRGNDLYAVDVATQRERALTGDGSDAILNGRLDWLYQEEIYGRGRFRGYWWSPDSARIAFLRLDERPVPEYTVVDHLPYRPALEVTDYPKAGDPNPEVTLGVVRIAGGAPAWIDTTAYDRADLLVVNVGWTPDSHGVVYQAQNREQTWLDLNVGDAATGASRRLLRETTKAWVNENGNPVWLSDGSFLWISERNGFRQLFRYRADGTGMAQVTTGRWDVATLYGEDGNGHVFFASPERSAVGMDIYRIGLDGSGLTRLSRATGTHRAIFNSDFSQFIDVWSDATTPAQVRLHRGDGQELRVIDANPVPALTRYALAKPEFVQVRARDGAMLEGMLIKPADFNPARRYPVYQFTYAGPGAGVVRDRWGGSQYMFHQLLTQQGVIVWMLDNRSASAKGVESQWPVYGRLGELELQDLEDGVAWLRQQSFVDPSRIVLSGWSYGGFMTAYALTHSTSWAGGVVGAPVTDWRDYDSIYTERLMKLPRNNPDGYARTAPRFAADRLQGRMLLVHGTMDDNVHMQNSVQFAYALQRAGKPFEMMLYPTQRHGFDDARLTKHLQQAILDFVLRTVGASAAPDSRTR